MSTNKIIETQGPLLQPDGSLAQIGWSPQPLLDCNLERTHTTALRFLQRLRIKRWDYYGLSTPEYFFSFTVSDVGYAGSVFAYAIHWQTGKFEEATITLPPGNRVILPRNSMEGAASFQNEQVEMAFETLPGERHLVVNWNEFGGAGKPPFCADVHLAAPPEHESLNMVIPISGGKFYFNRKINCMRASGTVNFGGVAYPITPETCLGNLDWGRGVWAYKSHWVWASASGFLSGDHTVGLNLGYGFGAPSAPSEHAIILDGRIHKLERVDFQFDPHNYKLPWRMTSPDKRLNLTFTPVMERIARTDLKVIVTEVHQMFGTYEGTFITEDGQEVQIRQLNGFAEEHYARW